jgi:CheY-like chemotaxis protein
MTILIVEDNASVRRLLKRALQGIAATQIWECEDGADALSAYRDHLPDVVLMDLRMPRMDGLAATRKILRDYPTARIVIVTDCDEDELRVAATDAGACGYALKQDLTELEGLLHSIELK